jgi:hypothetical protein
LNKWLAIGYGFTQALQEVYLEQPFLHGSKILDLVKRWGWAWLTPAPDAWRKKYPHVTEKIDQLETRIKKLENKGSLVDTYK